MSTRPRGLAAIALAAAFMPEMREFNGRVLTKAAFARARSAFPPLNTDVAEAHAHYHATEGQRKAGVWLRYSKRDSATSRSVAAAYYTGAVASYRGRRRAECAVSRALGERWAVSP